MPRAAASALLFAALAAGAFAQPERVGDLREQKAKAEAAKLTGDKALAAARLKPDDGAGLRGYLKLRTLSDADRGRIEAVIKRLGSEDFEARLAAEAEAEAFGPAAVGPLRKAATVDPQALATANFEIAYRAKIVLEKVETVPHDEVALAAVRALGKQPHPDTVPVLLGYLPVADTPVVADAARTALEALAVRDGKPDPALVGGLKAANPVVRAAAAVCLVRAKAADALPAVKAMAAAEADPGARFQVGFTLAVAGDADSVGRMVGTLANLPRGRLWQAEDYLQQLAGPAGPRVAFGKSQAGRDKAQAAWADWWVNRRGGADPATFQYKPRTTGRLLMVASSGASGAGAVTEFGPDGAELWKMTNLAMLTDAHVREDGTVAVALAGGGQQVEYRSPRGQIVRTRSLVAAGRRIYAQPTALQPLPNDGLLVVCRSHVLELQADAEGKDIVSFVWDRPQNYDIQGAVRLPDGTTAVQVQQGLPPGPGKAVDQYIVLVKDGKPVEGSKLKGAMPSFAGHLSLAGPTRILAVEQQQVTEYDTATGEAVWKYKAAVPRSAERLANGNTLVVLSGSSSRAVEVSPTGEELWEFQAPAGVQIARLHRR